MATIVASGQGFLTWLDIYDTANISNSDIEATDDRALLNLVRAEGDDSDDIMDVLVDFPYNAAFFGFVKTDGEIGINVVHHVVKKGPGGGFRSMEPLTTLTASKGMSFLPSRLSSPRRCSLKILIPWS